MENKFFTFSKPYFNYIDQGHLYRKPFSWLYSFFGIINLLVPIWILAEAIDNDILDAKAKFVLIFLLLWAGVGFASWVSFQLWWDRKSKLELTSTEGDDFVATPVFSHLIQTFGEWIGTWIGIVGFLSALITTVFLGEEGRYLLNAIGLDFLSAGFIYIIGMPFIGFMIIVFSRFLAEQFRALSSIANNTKKS
jgi:hypothetical protein